MAAAYSSSTIETDQTSTTKHLAKLRYSQDFPPFQPARGLAGPHAQTLWGAYAPQRRIPYRAVQHRIELPDNDEIILHDDCPGNWSTGQRTALLMHGLTGSHRSSYMERVADKLQAIGLRVFRMDLRGCGAGTGLARKPYHVGQSEDAAAAIQTIARLCPNSPLTLVGFSLSGNITAKLLGELGDQSCGGLDSAVAVCPPLDVARCSDSLTRFPISLYDRNFARNLRREIHRRARLYGHQEEHSVRQWRRIRHVDEHFTAPRSGFRDADDYYARCSGATFLPQIKRPLLILAALDDPLIPNDIYDRLSPSPAVDLYLSPSGGHLGFYGRKNNDPDRRWMDWRIVQWIESFERDLETRKR